MKLTAAGLAVSAFSPTSFATQLPNVAGPRTEVRPHLGKPTFFVDDQPYTKPVFETYVPETRFFEQFSEAGTDVFCFATNLGSGFAAATWKGPDDFDFKQLDERVQRVLQANPKGLLLPRIYQTAESGIVSELATGVTTNPSHRSLRRNGATIPRWLSSR
jgi:hypothetical protein